MRIGPVILVIAAAIVIVVFIRDAQLSAKIDSLSRQVGEFKQEPVPDQLNRPVSSIEQPASTGTFSLAENDQTQRRIVALENQIRTLQAALARQPNGPLVPEYDVSAPPPDVAPETNALGKRNWGPEQLLGPPDTMRSGDAVTAWASLESNAGPEWLSVGFDQTVEIAQMRIRESSNPGAISKVSAMVNGSEVILWEGKASTAGGLRDFVVPVSGHISANSVLINLDTKRTGAWPEIDAVELVGRDGSRQWATSASASSSYADIHKKSQAEISRPLFSVEK